MKKLRVAIGACMVLTATSALAATTVVAPSAACIWPDSNGIVPSFNGTAVNNSTTLRGFVSCGVQYDTAATNFDVFVYYSDGKTGTTNFDTLWCETQTCNEDNSTCTTNVTRYACLANPAGGCPLDPTPTSYSGSGYILWTSLPRVANAKTNVNCALPLDAGNKSSIKSLKVVY